MYSTRRSSLWNSEYIDFQDYLPLYVAYYMQTTVTLRVGVGFPEEKSVRNGNQESASHFDTSLSRSSALTVSHLELKEEREVQAVRITRVGIIWTKY